MSEADFIPFQLTLELDATTPGEVSFGLPLPLAVQPLTLKWSLQDCDTAAERAGMAALALLVNWCEVQPGAAGALTCAVDEHTLMLTVDATGLAFLLGNLYSWETVERRSSTRNSAVHRTEEVMDPETGKTRTVYFWNQDQPSLPFLASPDVCPSEAWLNLSRELIWRGLYSNKNARRPFYEGVNADELLADLRANARQKISGSALLTAGSRTAEKAEFHTSARQAFLLRFWPLVAQVFPVAEPEVDRKAGRVNARVRDRRAIAIPDVADLRLFTRHWRKVMRRRSPEQRGIYPAAAIIDLPSEAALIGFEDFRAVERMEVGRQAVQVPNALLGFEVVTIEKTAQSPRLHGVTYVATQAAAIDEYRPLRDLLRHGLLRPQILANAIARRPLWTGVTRVIRTVPLDVTIESREFVMDCNNATRNNKIAQTIRRMLRSYLFDRMNSVGGLVGDDVDREKWNREIGRAFTDVRDLSDDTFPAWFSRYLCGFTTAGADGLATVVNILYSDPGLCRELTLLALGSLRRFETHKETGNGSNSDVA